MDLSPCGDPLPAAPSRRHWHCEVCRQWMLPRLPHRGWRVAEVFVWAIMSLGIAAASKGPGMIALPLVVLIGGCIVGPLHAEAAADPRCPGCKRYIFPPKR